jgi:IS1 family transposase
MCKKNSKALEKFKEIEREEDLEPLEDSFWTDGSPNLLLEEIYEKQRGSRVQVFGIELDELWSFVQKKKNKQWIWLALNPSNKQIVGFYVGDRSVKSAQELYKSIPSYWHENASFFSDYWKAYQRVFESKKHVAVGKDSGLTSHIERFNSTLRHRVSRLVRKSLSFSKSLTNHIGAIRYFIYHYNLHKSLHL